MNTIIEEYFKITGRPIATMTVSEYLEFCRFTPTGNIQTSSWIETDTTKDKTTNKTTSKNDTKVNNTNNNSGHIKAPTEKPTQKDNQPKPVAVNTSPLDMLKSVSG